MNPEQAYAELVTRLREQALLASCSALLGWDEQTYMPRAGAEHRGGQMALLAGMVHERATDPVIGELLAVLEGSDLVADPESPPAVNVRETRRNYDRQTRIPRELVEALARATTLGQQAWAEARTKRTFALFLPHLETIVRLKRREAEAVGFEQVAYDALLDDYEPGATTTALAKLFATLKAELVPLVAAIEASTVRPDTSVLSRSYPTDLQRVFAELIAATIGFDFDGGRLDVSEHPFSTSIGPGDRRITTHYDQHDFTQAFFGVLHEVGHALYEQGLDPDHHGTPMGDAVSLGIHESQSRLWENAVGRGRAFWSYAFPIAQRVFRAPLRDVRLDDFHLAVNRVAPSLIRTQADEVTYNLHIIVRFELEQALIAGDLNVADLPGAWNERYRQALGVAPQHDGEGCLQDIHWSAGLFGYFPTYALGNLHAAQLMDQARADLADLDGCFARGEFTPLLEWLRANVHRQGQRFRAAALIERVTGRPPGPGPLVRALREKFTPLYRL